MIDVPETPDRRLGAEAATNWIAGAVTSAAKAVGYRMFGWLDRRAESDRPGEYRTPLDAKVTAFVICGGIAWLLVNALLQASATWPTSCHPTGAGVLGYIATLWCSPRLLSGSLLNSFFFLWVWSLPLFVVTAAIRTTLKRRRRVSTRLARAARKAPIQSPDIQPE